MVTLINLIVIIILPYTHVLNHHIIHLKLACYMSIVSQYKAGKNSARLMQKLTRKIWAINIPRNSDFNLVGVHTRMRTSLVAQWLKKNPPTNARDTGSIPGLGRFPGGGNGNPLQYSWLGNPMNRRTWQATVHGVAKELDTT